MFKIILEMVIYSMEWQIVNFGNVVKRINNKVCSILEKVKYILVLT